VALDGHGVNFVELLAGSNMEPLASALLVAGGLAFFGHVASKSLERESNKLIPDTTLSLRNIAELISTFIFRLGDNVMGKENRKYLPFVGTLFLFILSMNLLGLIPGFSMPTDSLAINGGVALTVFVLYNIWGIRKVGLFKYLKHFVDPILALLPGEGMNIFAKALVVFGVILLGSLFFCIELISHAVRPLSLSLRLFGNMTGDHIALAIFTDLTKVVIPVIFYCFGTFVCFMQAFVFTLLTMVYIRLAVVDQHEEAH
jgi:F-type H+-transporting ATPase subunit a